MENSLRIQKLRVQESEDLVRMRAHAAAAKEVARKCDRAEVHTTETVKASEGESLSMKESKNQGINESRNQGRNESRNQGIKT